MKCHMCNEVEVSGRSKFCTDCKKERSTKHNREYKKNDPKKCKNCGGDREFNKSYCEYCRKEKESITKKIWNEKIKSEKPPKDPSQRSVILLNRKEMNGRRSIINEEKLVYKERLRVFIMNIQLKGSLGLDDLNELLELWKFYYKGHNDISDVKKIFKKLKLINENLS